MEIQKTDGVQWLTNATDADRHARYWKLHAIRAPSGELNGLRALCGVRAKRGWGTHPLVTVQCGRCVDRATQRTASRGPAGLTEKTTARFWAKVDKNGPVPANRPDLGPCWLWTGALGSQQYGNFWTGVRYARAPRVSLELAGVSVDPMLDTCHHCDNPPCVNPAHLFVGTRKQNMRDMADKGRHGDTILTVESTRGEGNVKAKLTEDGVRALFADWQSGAFTKAVLARKYNVWPSNVQHILSGRTWRHLNLVEGATAAEAG